MGGGGVQMFHLFCQILLSLLSHALSWTVTLCSFKWLSWGSPPCMLLWTLGKQGWHSGEIARLPPNYVAWIWFRIGAMCGLLLVLSLHQVFFSTFSIFYSLNRNQLSKFQFDQTRRPTWKPAKADVASFLNMLILIAIKDRRVLLWQKSSNACFKVDIAWGTLSWSMG